MPDEDYQELESARVFALDPAPSSSAPLTVEVPSGDTAVAPPAASKRETAELASQEEAMRVAPKAVFSGGNVIKLFTIVIYEFL